MQLGPQFTGKKAETYQKLNLPRIQREMIELKAILDLLEEPLVFCHNDLLSGNILHVPATATTNNNPNTNNNSTSTSDATTNNTTGEVPSESPQVTLIDFEYGSLNYRAFDIANHFCESAGFECDWRQFPGMFPPISLTLSLGLLSYIYIYIYIIIKLSLGLPLFVSLVCVFISRIDLYYYLFLLPFLFLNRSL